MKNERLIEEFLAGFNDALMLVMDAKRLGSFEEALKCFDWSDRGLRKCQITHDNLTAVKKILIEAKVVERIFDVWEYAQKCEGCGRFDNHSPEAPTCYLDADTKLCEFCWSDKFEED